jgi:hypothetical protein
MSDVTELRILRCPYHLAQAYLEQSIAGHAESGESAPLTLSLAIPGVELVKNVTVTFSRATDPMHFDQPWHIHWTPRAGPYPDFDGELTVRADETYETCRLELRGSYRPPGGVAGAAFDKVLGHRIAYATARALLQRVGDGMEARYTADELAKEAEATR